jgi:hypothetical protein
MPDNPYANGTERGTIALTHTLTILARLLDSGEYDHVTVRQVKSRIKGGTIVAFLREIGGGHVISNAAFTAFYVDRLRGIQAATCPEELGTTRRGLAYLLALTSEVIKAEAMARTDDVVVTTGER